MAASLTDAARAADAAPPRERLDASGLAPLVGYAASLAAYRLRKSFVRHIGPLGLKIAEFSILMLVARNPEVNQKQLGAELMISAPNMAVTLDRMVEQGWVERVRSTADRRAQHIHLTPAGAQLAERASRIARTMEAPELSALSAAEQALLIELLHKVAAGKGAR